MRTLLPAVLLLVGVPRLFAQSDAPKPAYDFSLPRETRILSRGSTVSIFVQKSYRFQGPSHELIHAIRPRLPVRPLRAQ